MSPNCSHFGVTTNKGNTMANRFRVEIYDENKLNDVTIYSEQGVDKEYLTELAFSNRRNFLGNVRAYVYDTLKKTKTTALYLPSEVINYGRTNKLTRDELGL